jgi:hypothetical protein
MSDELICPDCGGIIGATEVTDEGKPCSCFAVARKPAAQVVDALAPENAAANGAADFNSPALADESAGSFANGASAIDSSANASSGSFASTPAPAVVKVCAVCGVEVSGKPRVRDSRGYLCLACHKAEVAAEKSGVKCDGCNRRVAESALSEVEGRMLCTFCRTERAQAAERDRKFGTVKTSNYKEADKSQIKWMVGALAILLFIIILHLLKVF